jgi:hypothetical protein
MTFASPFLSHLLNTAGEPGAPDERAAPDFTVLPLMPRLRVESVVSSRSITLLSPLRTPRDEGVSFNAPKASLSGWRCPSDTNWAHHSAPLLFV